MQNQDVLERPAMSYMQREFVTLEEGASVASAVEQMQSQKLESVIVTRGGLAVGIVTSGDVVEKVVLKGEDSGRISLKSVMSYPLVTMSSAGTVKQALQLMRLNKIKRIAVADGIGIIGVVTQRSLADAGIDLYRSQLCSDVAIWIPALRLPQSFFAGDRRQLALCQQPV